MDYRSKIRSKDNLRETVKDLQKEGKKIVQCHGCFDVLHPGHVRYFEFAKEQGDILVVSITADKFIVKGDDRPYVPQELRVEAVAALEIVDFVYLDMESWAGPILKYVKPDIYVKGKEYENQYSGVFGEERSIVLEYGGKVVFSSGDVVFSSSKFIKDFKKQFAFEWELYKVFYKRNNIKSDNLKAIVDSFNGKKIIVFGSTKLVNYHFTEVSDLANDAPVLNIRPLKSETFISGAGIIARHIKNLGGNSVLYTSLGNDKVGKDIRSELDNCNIAHYSINTETTKSSFEEKYFADEQQLLNIDNSQHYNFSQDLEHQLFEDLTKNHTDADCLIFADYASGLISENLKVKITDFCNEHDIPAIALSSNAIGTNILKYNDLFLIAPREKEVRRVLDDRTSGLSVIANKILKSTNNKNILITLGANDLLLFKNNRFSIYGKPEEHLESEYVPVIEKSEVDKYGSHEALISVVALSISSKASMAESVYLGNIGSAIHIRKMGNRVLSKSELMSVIEQHEGVIKG